MKTVVTEAEVNRVAVDAISLAIQKLPFNGQDDDDRQMAEHFLLRALDSKIGSRLRKLDDKVKDAFKAGDTKPKLTQNYRLEIEPGTPRMLFSVDKLIEMITAKYPDVPKHTLREMAAEAKAPAAAPLSITIEYVGDVARSDLP